MANRFWVGGSATWDATAGTKWATTSGGASGAAVPTAADDVFFDAASSGTCTTSATSVCRSIDCTGFTGTFSLANSATALTIGDAAGGALKFTSSMTLTIAGSSCVINFVSTSNNASAGWGVTTGGKIMPGLTFNGAGGKWVLQDNLTASSGTGTITTTLGTFDTNSKTIVCGNFYSSGTNTRSLILGTSSITCTGSDTSFSISVDTNLTFSGASSTITLNGARPTIFTGSINQIFGTINLTGPGLAALFCNVTTIANFNRTGTATKTDGIQFGIATLTITGTLTLSGNSIANRILVQSDTYGVARTLTCNGTISAAYCDFQDITGAGSASWNLSAATGGSGDAAGNSGITFTAPQTNYWVGGTGNWSDAANHWASSSGGSAGTGRTPLPQDTARLDGNSGTATATIDMLRFAKDLDCTGYTGTLARDNTLVQWQYGSLTLGSGMTLTLSGSHWELAGRGSHTITTNGKSIPIISSFSLIISGPGGTYTLQDDLTIITSANGGVFLALSNGTFNANGKNITVPGFFSNYTNTRTLLMGAGTWTITETGTGTVLPWWVSATGLTFVGNLAKIVISAASGIPRFFVGAGFTYNTLTITGGGGVGSAISLTGANTFNTISTGPGVLLTLPSATTTNVSALIPSVSNYGYQYLPGVNGNYLSSPDSAAVSVTGDIDIRCRMALDTWSPTTQLDFFSKWVSSPQISWTFYQAGGVNLGKLNFAISTTGSNSLPATSSAVTGLSAGQLAWVRVTRRQSDGRVQFFTSTTNTNDPSSVTWTQLGTNQTLSAGSAIFDGTSMIEIGSVAGGLLSPAGKYYRMQIRNNILDDGSGIVFDADLTQMPFGANTFNESSTNHAAVAINGTQAMAGNGRFSLAASTAGSQATLSKSSGNVSIDYASIMDSNATGGATFYAGSHSNSVSNNSGWIFSNPPATYGNFFTFFN